MSHKRGNLEEEKHVPYIIENEDGYTVRIGKPALHPMTEEHLITKIELYIDEKLVESKDLSSTDKPEVTFKVEKGTKVEAVEYCNLHGSWINEL